MSACVPQIAIMGSKWGDGSALLLSYDALKLPSAREGHGVTRIQFFGALAHRFSLLHALALAHLRRQTDVGDFNKMDETNLPAVKGVCAALKRTATSLTRELRSNLKGETITTAHTIAHNAACPLHVLGGLSQHEIEVSRSGGTEGCV